MSVLDKGTEVVSYTENVQVMAVVAVIILFGAIFVFRRSDVFAVILLLSICVGGVFAYILTSANEKAEWKEWASEHCTIVEKREGSTSLGTGVGIGLNGKVGVGLFSSSEPDQTGYKCDDGVTYWKND
ncbi:hypothetical protein M1V18_004405 [Salmonella enterica]|nr:hypothetical protein [Salmonella enterica]